MRKEPYRSLLITTSIYVVFFSIVLYNEFDVNLLNFNNSLPIELEFQVAGTEESGSSEPEIPEEIEAPTIQANEESILTQENAISFNTAAVKTGDTSNIVKNDTAPAIVGENSNNDGNVGGDTAFTEFYGEGGSDMVYSGALVAQHARFLGGTQDKFSEWLGLDIRANETLTELKPTGSMLVSFIVDIDGKLTDIRVLKGINEKVDREIVNLIKQSPNWEPGKQQNHPVKILYQMPIHFPN